MEENINDDILLVGEANFSFTLSLLKYCNSKYITTSCYESKEVAFKKYGFDYVSNNINELLKHLDASQILYEIDATKLIEHFPQKKFQRIIFMFPHVGGKSNIKKNRELILNFFKSARQVLKLNDQNPGYSNVFITLAKGQGGTSFEEDPKKRNNKDSWTINELAQQSGFILTQCMPLCEKKYQAYVSTGFRSQNKSFQTKLGLVHKFENSLPLENKFLNEKFSTKSAFPNLIWNCLDIANFFIKNDDFYSNERDLFIHPLVELKYLLSDHLMSLDDDLKSLNFIKDNLEYFLIKTDIIDDSYGLDENFINFLNNKFDLQLNINMRNAFFRNSLLTTYQSLDCTKYAENKLNVFSGLVNKDLHYENESFFNKIDLNCLKYEILFQFNKKIAKCISSKKISDFFCKAFESFAEICVKHFNSEKTYLNILNNNCNIVEIIENDTEIICILDASSLLLLKFNLNDERILYSNDMRAYSKTNLKDDVIKKSILNFKWNINQFSIENNKWVHDISFWCDNNNAFSLRKFINTIKEVCWNLVKSIELLDIYSNESLESNRYARCYRFYYQSYDRCLSHNTTTIMQKAFRDYLASENIELR